ncbi:MAG: tRNA (adenosine(37)-N6)-threonylcarbamoyltransferase complex ATPase subunit type 1 TsaE [Candidatus Marinimicrobia bacterium]|jgi:tRNA threonylcarbamoyladenosine biosynthesis protein TsaE|uniref:tRNA threonylcarbamoyladenosine biosynthesis protein TsaE n=1 Tax=uncultured bacterium FPPS_57A9 TaxID=1343847 RepID=S4W7K9_9BACT|nr:hypothetical protein [uncultured bacterium FPPS_57A9]MBT3300381.1 tRNA (adenosine(37)-N6)-threonylcarbamoyltransferase complex ATPase subunit type 1 TsaE [Candidatus Neomarinimicrobiota bacterium]MBT3495982.1 tRNA (adenosine(37)-N6)-threonylcarbamoyltransferase complex ATPase subunit type 1 TsaE [Candidatus Neomarinimicrobiota bacterium]MBT3691818.1 tRNA (adenosine(37)-N6)-threonylcarbamoyltransferase complex ATPase subunit type 1 TsaE [Candidatus Neomarinimicrobiota bacterium]MBT3732712.1 t
MTQENLALSSVDETKAFGEKIGQKLPSGSVIALYGNLGAGKTTFAQGFAIGLQIQEHVGSPTFKLVGEYEGNPHKLYHIDCYRLDKPADFIAIGGDEYLHPEDGVTLIEWADKIEPLLPKNLIRITLKRDPENANKRDAEIQGIAFKL